MDTRDWGAQLDLKSNDALGDFVLEQIVGFGGTAVVYKGHRKTDRSHTIAIKILNSTLLDIAVEEHRLKRQQSLAGHTCPFLLQPLCYFHSTVRDTHGIEYKTLVDISQYVEGSVLEPALLPADRVEPILAMIAQAAQYLDSRGFVHRDIKPENVVVTPGYKRAVLLDLGVLHATTDEPRSDPTTTTANLDLVTTRYSSPELLLGKLTPKSDKAHWLKHTFYQLGALIFEAITLKKLFAEHQGKQLVAAVVTETPVIDDSTRLPSLSTLARNCLDKSPDKRPSDWTVFECKRGARIPTVVFLYCGGTIGSIADARGESLEPRKLDNTSPLLASVTRRVILEYRESAPDAPAVDIQWRFVDRDHQIFSENATPATWNAIVQAIEDTLAEPWDGRYLLGIVVLHGTDTLGFTAAALQLALPRLPCPIVLTGANQPPQERQDTELSRRTSKSDAWRNLARSIMFLTSGGHRLPMVYVVFAATVCHAVNAQKIPVNRLTLRHEIASRFLTEPFVYRNGEIGRRYAYKFVEGNLVNSFLPILEQVDVTPTKYEPAAWQRVSCALFEVRSPVRFALEVSTHHASPDGVSPHATAFANFALLVGFCSGTTPSMCVLPPHVVSALTTLWGLSPGQKEYAGSRDPGATRGPIKLFRVVPETALPLLSLAASVDRSHIESAIMQIIENSSVLRALLGNPLDREDQALRARHLRDRDDKRCEETVRSILGNHTDRPTARRNHRVAQGFVEMRKTHFEALIFGFSAPFGSNGCLSDFYSSLFDVGFDTGASLAIEMKESAATVADSYRAIAAIVRAAGFGQVDVEFDRERDGFLKVIYRTDITRQDYYREAWVVDCRRDFAFIQQLALGVPLEESVDDTTRYFDDLLVRLHRGAHIHCPPMAWYLLGCFKGAFAMNACDEESQTFGAAGNLRGDVSSRVCAGKNDHEVVFEFSLASTPQY